MFENAWKASAEGIHLNWETTNNGHFKNQTKLSLTSNQVHPFVALLCMRARSLQHDPIAESTSDVRAAKRCSRGSAFKKPPPTLGPYVSKSLILKGPSLVSQSNSDVDPPLSFVLIHVMLGVAPLCFVILCRWRSRSQRGRAKRSRLATQEGSSWFIESGERFEAALPQLRSIPKASRAHE